MDRIYYRISIEKVYADEFGIDPERIGVRGFSSGGYLALMLGVTNPADNLEGSGVRSDFDSSVRAVVNHSGPVDFVLSCETVENIYHINYLGGRLADIPDVYKRASVISYIDRESDAPTLTIHGKIDRILSIEQAYKLDSWMGFNHGNHTLIVQANLGHTRSTSEMIWLFFDKYLKY